MLRMDAGFARLSLLINQTSQRPMRHVTGRELEMSDFMVYVADSEPKSALSFESAAKTLMALAGAKKDG